MRVGTRLEQEGVALRPLPSSPFTSLGSALRVQKPRLGLQRDAGGPPERRAEGKLCTQASHELGWEQGLGPGILSVVLKPAIREISRSENCL